MKQRTKEFFCKILGHRPHIRGGIADGVICKRCKKRLTWQMIGKKKVYQEIKG